MRIALILSSLLLSACMATPEPPAAAADTTGQSGEKQSGDQLNDAIQAPIDKAKGVEVQVQDGAKEEADKIEAAGG